jgi:hypothetical protein
MTPFAFATSIRFGRGTFRDLPGHAAGQGQRVLLLRSASVARAVDLACALLGLTARGDPDLPASRNQRDARWKRAVNAVPGV